MEVNAMFRLTTLSIRSLLLLITFVVALPAAGIILFSGLQYRNEMLNDARRETQKLSDRIVSEQQSLAAGAEQLMTALAQLPDVKKRDADKVEPILRELQRQNPMYANIVIADREGTVWAAAIGTKPTFNVVDRRYFKNALASGTLSSGEYILSRATSKATFNLAYPLKDIHGAPGGVIAIGFKLDQYRQLLDRMQLPVGSSFVLMDHKGTILFRAINPEAFIGKPYMADEFRKMKEGPESGTSFRLGIRQNKRIISYRKLRLAGEQAPYMYVTAGIPEEIATRAANRALANNMTLLTSFLALACFGAALIGKRSIVDRFRLLENAAQRLAAGDLQARVSDLVVGGELGRLGQTFDAMAEELARRESERLKTEEDRDRLISILETTTDVVSQSSPEGQIIYLNRAGRELTGIGDRPVTDVFIPQIHPEWAAELIMKEGIPTAIKEGVWEGETATLDCTGQEVPVFQLILSHRDAHGNLSHLSTIIRDIREQKRAATALEHNSNLLNESQALSHTGSWQWEITTNEVQWSDEQFRIFGYQPEATTPSLDVLSNSLHPEDRERVLAAIRKSVEQGTPFVEECRICRPDGTERIIYSQGEVKRDEDGCPVRMIGSVLDVTERRQAEESLYITQFAVEKSADAVFWINQDASFFNVNEAACRSLGYTKDELLSMCVFDVDPVFPQQEWDDLWERVRSQRSLFLETFHKSRDGRVFPVELTSNRVQFAGKEYLCAFVRDITERKKAEEALRASEAFLDNIIEHSPYSTWISDEKGTLIRMNQVLRDTLHITDEDMIGKYNVFEDRLVEEQGFMPLVRRVFEQGEKIKFTMFYDSEHIQHREAKQPIELYLDLTVSPVLDARNRVSNAIFQHVDITERKRMEEALQEREAQLRATMDSIPFDLYAIDRSGCYCMQSPASIGIWGNVIGKRPEEVLYDDPARDRWLENNQQALDGKTVQGEVDYLVNGVRRYFIEIVTPIRTDEEIIGVLGINIDQTERKHAEEERQQLEEQLIQAQKMESIGRLAGGVAHDFNNLLTPIIIYTEMLKKALQNNEGALARAENILKAAMGAKVLVQQLLSFSRNQVLEMKTIDLNQIITDFQSILRHTIRESIDIRFRLAEEQCCIRADRNQIEQVIMNLTVNAQDAIGEHGAITVETASVLLDDEHTRQYPEMTPGRYLMLAVSDDGCGMDEKTRQRIFEPFFTTKGIGKGTGLGLATVYGIVRQHGGNIWVYSEPGKGTTFKCYFPFVDEPTSSEQPAEHEHVPLAGERRTILLVEDNEMVRTLVDDLLTQKGFEVLVAEEPIQALQMYENRSIDLLVTDVVMPYMTGPELHSRLHENHPGLKVLFISGYNNTIIANKGLPEEGISFIQKPFAIAEFAKSIEALLMPSANLEYK
jgi:PAS domain S-box-containing protein